MVWSWWSWDIVIGGGLFLGDGVFEVYGRCCGLVVAVRAVCGVVRGGWCAMD